MRVFFEDPPSCDDGTEIDEDDDDEAVECLAFDNYFTKRYWVKWVWWSTDKFKISSKVS